MGKMAEMSQKFRQKNVSLNSIHDKQLPLETQMQSYTQE